MNLETDAKLFLTEEETRDFLAAETAKATKAAKEMVLRVFKDLITFFAPKDSLSLEMLS